MIQPSMTIDYLSLSAMIHTPEKIIGRNQEYKCMQLFGNAGKSSKVSGGRPSLGKKQEFKKKAVLIFLVFLFRHQG